MSDKLPKRRADDMEPRSKVDLQEEITRINATAESSIGRLLHDLQVYKVELEAQNLDLRQSQQQLEESRDKYADLYDFAPAGYLTLDDTGKVLDLNLTAAAMLGRERKAILGQNFSFCLSQREIASFMQHLQQSFAAQCNSAVQCNIVTELKIKPMHTAPRVVRMESWAKSGSRTCRTVMIDITQQKVATEALERNLAAQEALLKAIPAVVFYQDMDLRFIAASQAFADFTGHAIADLIGKTAYDVLPQAVADDFYRTSKRVLDSGAVSVVPEYQMSDAQGDQIFVSVVRTPYRDARGKIIGLVGAGIDISAIKLVANINAQLLQENRALTRNLFEIQETERRHLARELHDELGQWLTAIQAEAQAICNISTADPKILDGAKAINTSARAVHEVVRSMLRHLRPSLLDELGLTDSLHELQRQWCRSRPRIACEFNLDIPPAGMSENINITVYRLIQEALSNVANHASASKVVVTLQREAGNTHDTEVLLLNIEDDGVGFDTQMKTSGMGVLGMRERVIAAGGGFVIYSKLGRGTHIQASLPLTFQEST